MEEQKIRALENEITQLRNIIEAMDHRSRAGRTWIDSAKIWLRMIFSFIGAMGVMGVLMEGLRWHWAVMIGIGGLTLYHALQTEKSSTAMKQLLADTRARLDEAEDELKNETAEERLKALFTKSG